MQPHIVIPEHSLNEDQGKGTYFKNQFIRAFEGFYRRPQTMMELSVATGIDRANLCRYCRLMRMAGRIAIVKRSHCSITKHIANKYTTNPKLFPKQNQLSLFDTWGGTES